MSGIEYLNKIVLYCPQVFGMDIADLGFTAEDDEYDEFYVEYCGLW